MKITSNHDNVEYKLKHLVKLVDEVCEGYGHVEESEHVAMLMALDRDMLQVAHNMEVVRGYLYKFLFDPFKVDYDEWKATIDKKVTQLEKLLAETRLEDDEAITEQPEDIVERENTKYKDVTYTRTYDTDVSTRVRTSLLRSQVNIYRDVINGFRAISDTLSGINNDKDNLLKNQLIRGRHFKELYKNFLASEEWEKANKAFKREVKHYVAAHADKKEGYQLLLEGYEDLHGDDIETELCKTYLENYDISSFIVRCRNEITQREISSLFVYIKTHQMLTIKVQSFEVLKAPDNNHNKLFINQGAQELIETMIPLFAKNVDFDKAYKYAALYYAIQDMGLMPENRSNAPQFVNFVGKHFKEEMTNDSITKKTKLLSGHSYGKVARENYRGTTLNDEEFDALRDEYHLCLSIINKIMMKDLAEEGFAQDVWKEHRNTPSFTDYEQAERMILLRDILQGKHTEI